MAATINLPVFDSRYANCEGCGLKTQLNKGHFCCAYRPPPEKFNGIMIVGEGPGQQEVSHGRPFVGPAGQLLRSLLSDAGIDMDSCYVTNATLCKPPPKDKALHTAFPTAIPSCLGRLEAEIVSVRPKIILAFGSAAWIALSGRDVKRTKNQAFDCPDCDPVTRKVGPVLQCAGAIAKDDGTSEPCGYTHFFAASTVAGVKADEMAELREQDCPKCGARFKRLRPKMIKCPSCSGRKTRSTEFVTFEWEYGINAAAGAIFEPAKTAERAEYELDSWYHEQGVQYILPTFHPAFLLRGQQFLAKSVQKHLRKVLRLLRGGKVQQVKYRGTKDPAVVRAFCWAWQKTKQPAPVYSIDIETEGRVVNGKRLDARKLRNVEKIKCIGISTTESTLVVDTREADPSDPNDPLLAVLCDFLIDERIPKASHHGFGYDLPLLTLLWGIPWEGLAAACIEDTLHAHLNLYPDEPHRLEHVAVEVADIHAWKPPRNLHGSKAHDNYEQLEVYNARDAWHTALAVDHFGIYRGKAIPGGRMDRAGLAKVYEVDSRLRQIALGMTMHGLPLNYKKFKEVGARSKALIADAIVSTRRALKESGFAGHAEINLNSQPQVTKLLFGHASHFRLAAVELTGKQQPSTTKTHFQKLLGTVDDPLAIRVLSGLAELRKQQYIAANFVFSASMQPWADGRIHPIWQPWGTRTGRFSSSPNAQNVPLWLRAAFEVEEGRSIVGADSDQLELREIALQSGDPELVRRVLTADESRKLEPEHDPHSYIASIAFPTYTKLLLKDPTHKKPDPTATKIEKCPCQTCKRKTLRDIIKRVIYGLNYGAGSHTVLEAIYDGGYEGPPLTVVMIEHVKRTVFKEYAGIPVWRDNQVELAMESGAIYSPFMHRRRIFPLVGVVPGMGVPNTEIYNFPIQSGGADIINEAFLLFAAELPSVDPTAFIIAQIHDAIYAETSAERAQDVKRLLEQCMRMEKTLNGVTMRFSATGKVSHMMAA